MSKYYTKLPDGSFREDDRFWHEATTGEEPSNVSLYMSLFFIAIAVIGYLIQTH